MFAISKKPDLYFPAEVHYKLNMNSSSENAAAAAETPRTPETVVSSALSDVQANVRSNTEMLATVTTKIISDPDDPDLDRLQDALMMIFDPKEVEPKESVQKSLEISADPEAKSNYIISIAKDQKGEVLGVCSASVINSDAGGIIAVRFFANSPTVRQPGALNSRIQAQAFSQAQEWSTARNIELKAVVAEAVTYSELMINKKTNPLDPGNSVRRVYIPASYPYQFPYCLPPFVWDSETGLPIDPETNAVIPESGIMGSLRKENFMTAVKGQRDQIQSSDLATVITAWWKDWYYRPREEFGSDQSYAKHMEIMDRILKSILDPLQYTSYVLPIASSDIDESHPTFSARKRMGQRADRRLMLRRKREFLASLNQEGV